MNPIFFVITLFIILEILSFLFIKNISNFKIFHYLMWPGIFLHEFSHYLACKLTFARVKQFRVGFHMGHVVHHTSKIPILGGLLITLAPFLVGVLVLILLFSWITGLDFTTFFQLFQSGQGGDWRDIKAVGSEIIASTDFLSVRFVVFLFFVLNILATFAPSAQDYRNVIWGLIIYTALSVFFRPLVPVNLLLFHALVFSNILLLAGVIILSIGSGVQKKLRG
ncbi:MAG TPA: hypothetical protein VJA22_03235 [Patescibacteria group bacterium]|nr:hypothetical protein [Patescibacteria group bacterium]